MLDIFICYVHPIFCYLIILSECDAEVVHDIVELNSVWRIWFCSAHLTISHCSNLLLKCRGATNISHWLKVHSRGGGQKLNICEKVYFAQLLDFPISLLLFPYTLLVCHIWMLDFGCHTVWVHIRPDVSIWVQTVCKCYPFSISIPYPFKGAQWLSGRV